jgi:hypothetical protein
MDIRSLTMGLQYSGEVEGKRQTYYVFRGRSQYLVMSFSRSKANAGNFNVVASHAVEYVAGRFGGKQRLTAKILNKTSRRPRLVRGHLAALNILYVLVAIGRAKIDARFQEREIYFNVKKAGSRLTMGTPPSRRKSRPRR